VAGVLGVVAVGLVFAAIAVPFLGSASLVIWRAGRLRRHGLATTGSLVSLPRRSRSGLYSAVVRFRTRDGTVVTVESTLTRRRGRLRPGDRVQVWYAPEHPHNAVVRKFDTGLPPLVFLSLGFGVTAIGIVVVRSLIDRL